MRVVSGGNSLVRVVAAGECTSASSGRGEANSCNVIGSGTITAAVGIALVV